MNLGFQELGCDRYHASQYIISSQILESESESLRSKKESPPVPSPIMHSFLFWRHLTRMIQIMLVLVNKPPDNQSFMFTLSSLAHIRCMPGCLIYMPIYHIISILFFCCSRIVVGAVPNPTSLLTWCLHATALSTVGQGHRLHFEVVLRRLTPIVFSSVRVPRVHEQTSNGCHFRHHLPLREDLPGCGTDSGTPEKIIQWSGYLSHMRLSL